jgi:hypothetical protein
MDCAGVLDGRAGVGRVFDLGDHIVARLFRGAVGHRGLDVALG